MNWPVKWYSLPAMNAPLEPLEYCPSITGSVKSVIERTQAPPALVFMSALSTLSIVLQGLIDVERPNLSPSPVGVYTLTVADSGERKSSVARCFEKPIHDFQRQENDRYLERLSEYEIDKEIFDEEIKAIRKEIKKYVRAKN